MDMDMDMDTKRTYTCTHPVPSISKLTQYTPTVQAIHFIHDHTAVAERQGCGDPMASSRGHGACALEKNERACRFYAKHGWTAAGVVNTKIETTLLRPGALHPTLFMHPWRQVRFQKSVGAAKRRINA